MKPHILNRKALISTSVITTCLCGAMVSLLSVPVNAQTITNYFTDGDGNDSTPLDQYPSAAGNGWLAGWTEVLGSASVLTVGVSNTATLNGGGNYLSWSIASSSAASTLKRAFNNADIDVTQPYFIEFDYRLDLWTSAGVENFGTFSSANDFVAIQLGTVNSPSTGDLQARGAFMVRAQGATGANQVGLPAKTWGFFDANMSATTENLGVYVAATNVPFATNIVYRFRFDVDPLNRLYEATVTDGTNTFSTTAATGRKLRWRQFGPPLPFTTDFYSTTSLNVVSRCSATGEGRYQSFDNLRVQALATNEWPPRVTQVNPVRAQTFYPAASNLVLNVLTYGTNSLPASNVVLNLNGKLFTAANGLTFDGDDATNNRIVTFSDLKSTTSYEGILTVADQAGRTANFSFFFDTFATNYVTVLEIENFNFGPTETPCSPVQEDTSKTDRYIQNWEYSGLTYDSQIVNITNGYFMRRAVFGIDFENDTANTGSNFRTCPAGINIRNETSDDFNRAEQLWTDGVTSLRENIMERANSNMWFNYTFEWPTGKYLVYLRGGATIFTNFIFGLGKVTSDYTQPNQTITNVGRFKVVGGIKREILKNHLLTDDQHIPITVSLSGKETLRLYGIAGNTAAANGCFLNYMVFIPAPEIIISDADLNGSVFSFGFNTLLNAPYTVEYTDDVVNPTWTSLTTLTGTGSPVVIQDSPVSGDARFYRVTSP